MDEDRPQARSCPYEGDELNRLGRSRCYSTGAKNGLQCHYMEQQQKQLEGKVSTVNANVTTLSANVSEQFYQALAGVTATVQPSEESAARKLKSRWQFVTGERGQPFDFCMFLIISHFGEIFLVKVGEFTVPDEEYGWFGNDEGGVVQIAERLLTHEEPGTNHFL